MLRACRPASERPAGSARMCRRLHFSTSMQMRCGRTGPGGGLSGEICPRWIRVTADEVSVRPSGRRLSSVLCRMSMRLRGHVHPGVQAARLLHRDVRLPGGAQRVSPTARRTRCAAVAVSMRASWEGLEHPPLRVGQRSGGHRTNGSEAPVEVGVHDRSSEARAQSLGQGAVGAGTLGRVRSS